MPKSRGLRQLQAVVAVGDGRPALEDEIERELRGQRRNGEMHALDAQRRQPEHDAGDEGSCRARADANEDRHAADREQRTNIGADADEGRVPDRQQPGIADA